MHLQLCLWHLKSQAVSGGHSAGTPYRNIEAALGPSPSLQGWASWMLGRRSPRPALSKSLQKQELGKAKCTGEQPPHPNQGPLSPPGTVTLIQRHGQVSLCITFLCNILRASEAGAKTGKFK